MTGNRTRDRPQSWPRSPSPWPLRQQLTCYWINDDTADDGLVPKRDYKITVVNLGEVCYTVSQLTKCNSARRHFRDTLFPRYVISAIRYFRDTLSPSAVDTVINTIPGPEWPMTTWTRIARPPPLPPRHNCCCCCCNYMIIPVLDRGSGVEAAALPLGRFRDSGGWLRLESSTLGVRRSNRQWKISAMCC